MLYGVGGFPTVAAWPITPRPIRATPSTPPAAAKFASGDSSLEKYRYNHHPTNGKNNDAMKTTRPMPQSVAASELTTGAEILGVLAALAVLGFSALGCGAQDKSAWHA